MSKIIKIGGDNYEIQYSAKLGKGILDKIVEWMENKNHYASHSGEGIMQDDNCTIDSSELISDIVDDYLKPKSIDNEEI